MMFRCVTVAGLPSAIGFGVRVWVYRKHLLCIKGMRGHNCGERMARHHSCVPWRVRAREWPLCSCELHAASKRS